MAMDLSIIVIGAGMAGLAAAAELDRAGLSVCILEARSRIGGRVFTLRDSQYEAPIELGAEFIHGLPREIWEPLQRSQVKITEVEGCSWCVSKQGLSPCNFFSEVDSILDKMDDSLSDESFLEFLERDLSNSNSNREKEAKRRALGYVSGFNAADPALVGVHWLVQGMRAEGSTSGRSGLSIGERIRRSDRHLSTANCAALGTGAHRDRGRRRKLEHGSCRGESARQPAIFN